MDKKIFERIKRLLAMAEDASSPNEAAIAARRAKSLMDAHQIASASEILDEIREDTGLVDESITVGNKTVPSYLSVMATAIGKFYDCEISRGMNTVQFYGYKDDVKLASYAFSAFRSFLERAAEKSWQENKGGYPPYGTPSARAYKGDFRRGFASGLSAKLRHEKALREREQTATGTELVVVKKGAITEKYGQFRYVSSSSRTNGTGGHSSGYVSGKNASINKGVNGSKRAAIR